jgi:outer membrane protein OmpA-like peptidoglycan-associated protein
MTRNTRSVTLGFIPKLGLGLLLGATLFAGASAQDIRATLFAAANTALEEARSAQANLLAPRAFERGAVAYTDAEADLERGRSLERITSRLEAATTFFAEATTLANVASDVLAASIETRTDATDADAETFAPEIWQQAEAAFDAAARRLEAGDADTARERSMEAEALYSDAELAAIKAQHLSRTQALLAQAEQARVPRIAPQTFARAAGLLRQAEQALDEDRYAIEQPLALAERANYEARHAMYLAARIQAVRNGEATEEDLILGYEQALADVAAAADLPASLDNGPDSVTADLSAYIGNLQERERQLLAESEENRLQIIGLSEEIRELDERLGGVSEERTALVQRLEADAAARAQFSRIESAFSAGEALVYREGNNLILRLVGLSFESGESTIDPSHRPLLEKVRDAADVFPRSLIVIEGHTDSLGSDTANLSLSRSRAEAVGAFLTDEFGVAGFRIRAMGFGETQPIANNESAQGRARNRRIDVRIEPQED